MFGAMLSPPTRLVCRGPVKYVGQEALAIDLANLRAALAGKDYTEVFMSAALPTALAQHEDEYYSSREEFITALRRIRELPPDCGPRRLTPGGRKSTPATWRR